jgi:phosphoglycerate dehydrogenase-like enzyme
LYRLNSRPRKRIAPISRKVIGSPTPRPIARDLGVEELDDLDEIEAVADVLVVVVELDDGGLMDVET